MGTYLNWLFWQLAGATNNWLSRYSFSTAKKHELLATCACLIFASSWLYSGVRSWHRLNCLPPPEFLYFSRRRICGLYNFWTPLSWSFFASRGSELYQNCFKFTGIRNVNRSYTFVPVSGIYYCYFAPFVPPCFSRRHHYTINRPEFKHVFL